MKMIETSDKTKIKPKVGWGMLSAMWEIRQLSAY